MKDVVFGVVVSCCVAAVLVCYLLYHITRASSKCFPCSDSRDLALREGNPLERSASRTLSAADQALRSAAALGKNVPSISFPKGLALKSAKILEKNAMSSQKAVDDKEVDFFASFSTMIEGTEQQLKHDFDKALAMVDALETYFDHVLLEKVNILETKVKHL